MPKHPGGRPTEYNEAKLKTALDYIENHFEKYGDPVPTVEGMCVELKISKQCCYEWNEKFPEFGDALDALKVKQAKLLQSGGLQAKYQPVITKLMLSANHGMAEKTEEKHEHSGEIKFSSADKAIAEIDSTLKK